MLTLLEYIYTFTCIPTGMCDHVCVHVLVLCIYFWIMYSNNEYILMKYEVLYSEQINLVSLIYYPPPRTAVYMVWPDICVMLCVQVDTHESDELVMTMFPLPCGTINAMFSHVLQFMRCEFGVNVCLLNVNDLFYIFVWFMIQVIL